MSHNTKEPAGENVRKVTSQKQNESIDEMIFFNIRNYAGKSAAEISERIKQLDKEWDIERVLDLNMSALALCGITLSLVFNPYSIVLPILLLLFFIWHAFQGWCPPIPILRYFKIRTRPEIDREKYALKAMRGDFKDVFNEEEFALRAFKATQKI
ncbi:MAG: hypothetical protein WAQ28_17730 [Bacteroidia bacterium]|jgi:hypothetical protein